MRNKSLICVALLLFNFNFVFTQSDYINKEQFKHFRTNRILISNWQINQLADSGALVVRLKSNKKAIDALKKSNQLNTAQQIEKQTFLINKKTVSAFARYYTFSKAYFIYDYSSDSLLKDIRKGIFLDTNLQRDFKIEMKEKFYLIAEKDDVVQSSIGWVPETEANKVSETGAPIKTVAIVIKNKYGHQLKRPFPFYIKGTYINKYDLYVKKLVHRLNEFKKKNPRTDYPADIKDFLY